FQEIAVGANGAGVSGVRRRICPGSGVKDDFPDAGGPPSGEDVIQIGNDVFLVCGQVFGTESSGPAQGGEPDPDPEQTEELKRVCMEAGIFPLASETNSPTGLQYENTGS
ncbi:MAG: hypothetical protein M3426_13750, partial [Actinomycetota bacterium]|nr:hypothetical protein [Actinomycetota bacterium]